MDKLKARLQLAKDIDKLSHKDRKAKHERNWLRETAEAMDIELDSDFASDGEDKSGGGGGGLTKRERKARDAKAASLRAELTARTEGGRLESLTAARGIDRPQTRCAQPLKMRLRRQVPTSMPYRDRRLNTRVSSSTLMHTYAQPRPPSSSRVLIYAHQISLQER